MKTLTSVLIALSVLAGAVAPASAAEPWNPDQFWQQVQRNLP